MPCINIPFSGFYESIWSQAIDYEEERDVENLEEHEREEQPEELQIPADQIAEFFFDCADYSNAYRTIAREYCEEVNRTVSDEIGIYLAGEFDGMDSPREYNFTTDRLYLTVPDSAAAALFATSAADDHRTLAAAIRERHTSYDGFISFYRNELAEWLAKPIEDWDHNELGTLLIAVMVLRDIDTRDLEWRIYESLADGCSDGSDGFFQAWSDCVDWEKFDAKMTEHRADLLEDLKAEEPDYVPPYRCPETPDMFVSAGRQ
jgi:hypothetical protein